MERSHYSWSIFTQESHIIAVNMRCIVYYACLSVLGLYKTSLPSNSVSMFDVYILIIIE